jgi:hypothetical protein
MIDLPKHRQVDLAMNAITFEDGYHFKECPITFPTIPYAQKQPGTCGGHDSRANGGARSAAKPDISSLCGR